PRVAFRLESGGRAIIDLPADESLAGRCRALFGRDLADGLLPVAASAGPMQVAGFVAHPREAKATAKRQYLFLNGRHVRDRLLVAAVREGFKGFLEPRLHGAVFLALDLDPSLVDVNVHPTKAEVRFRREGEVFALVSRAINQVLAQHSGGFSLFAAAAPALAPAATDAPFARTIVKTPAPAAAPVAAPMWQERFLPSTPMTEPARQEAPAMTLPADPPRRVSDGASAYQPPVAATASRPTADPHLPGVRRVLQLDDMYLLIETDSGIRLIDQHALHEKALWLQLDAAATDLARGGVQELLIPRTVELSAAEVATVEPLLPPLTDHGIRAEVFGPTTLLLRAHPAALRRMNWSGFFTSLAASGSGAKALADVRERIGHSIACHGAVKAGQRLSTEEQLDLVRLLYRLEHMEHCPHGRPTTLDLSWKELERRFQRS
ncbi:MAG: hypothetical protein H0X45_01830, partial [Planctomycetes bacterium]|nr:hypothetical protein [Planctomycetota bacterium]